MKLELNPIKKMKVYLGMDYLVGASGVSNTTWHNWDNAGGCPGNRVKAVLGISKGVVTEQELQDAVPQTEFKVKK
jgi:hypothetical protein